MYRQVSRIALLSVLILIFTGSTEAQKGNPYISNFPLDELNDQRIFSIVQGSDQVMYFASRRGIVYFDSEERFLIPTPTPPLALALDTIHNRILVGGMNDIGYVERDSRGQYHYVSLFIDKELTGNFNHIQVAAGSAWFYSEGMVLQLSFQEYKISKTLTAPRNTAFHGMVYLNKRIFLNSSRDGLMEATDGSLKPSGILALASEKILFSIPLAKDECMFGTENGALYRFDGRRIIPLAISDSIYMKESILQNGIDLGHRYALSTLLGGCLIIDKQTGKTDYFLNFTSGLPDDEIYALGKDRNDGLWLAHQYGLSRVALQFPVKNFSNYPGIQGTLNTMVYFNNTIYVNSNEGVYFLKKFEEYVATDVAVKKSPHNNLRSSPDKSKDLSATGEKTTKAQADTLKTSTLSKRELRKLKKQQEEQQSTEKKPGFLARIFGSFQPEEKKEQAEQAPEIALQKKRIYSLQAVHYRYIKVEGIAGKCRQMLVMGNRLLVATNIGLYDITGSKATPVILDTYIRFIKASGDNKTLYAGASSGVRSYRYENGKWQLLHQFNELKNRTIYDVEEDREGTLWMGSEGFLYRIKLNEKGIPAVVKPIYVQTDYTEPLRIKFIGKQLYVFISTGIYKFQGDSLQLFRQAGMTQPRYYLSIPSVALAYIDNQWCVVSADQARFHEQLVPYLNLFDGVQELTLDETGNLWVVDMNSHLACIESRAQAGASRSFSLLVKDVKNDQKKLFPLENFVVDYSTSALSFDLVAPFYLKENAVEYQYMIEPMMNTWSDWSTTNAHIRQFVPYGKHALRVRARNILGVISNEQTLTFTVRPPFYLKIWFILLCVMMLVALVLLAIRLRVRNLKAEKQKLEEKVRERTLEIQHQKERIEEQRDELAMRNEEILQQKEEIEAQRDEIEAQNNALEDQNYRIALQNQEITDSILYAKRIQTAVMPSESEVTQIIPDSFIFFKPRNIVSGDFYWMTRKKEKTMVVAADCTGHGVPGAFMSMLGISFLNEIVNGQELPRANDILNELRQNVLNTLSQKVENVDIQDGMDIALVIIDRQQMKVEYAGAFNPLVLIRKGEMHEIPANRMPIGAHVFEKENFSSHWIDITAGDALYIFSDGYISQFGGDDDRKFNSKAFRQLLLNIHNRPMKEQKDILETTMKNWMRTNEQMDDMLVIGIRI